MLVSMIIGFREALEAALIIGIILAFLIKTKKERYNNVVYIGILSALVASVITAFLFNWLAGGFEDRSEQIFEGITMFLAAGILTYMVVWMRKQKEIAVHLRKRVSEKLDDGKRFGLFFLAFISVFREGVETVLFVSASSLVGDGNNSLVGLFIGVALAIVLGYFVFVSSKRVPLGKFFKITTFFLILFAAGLLVHGVHEFQEASIIPIIHKHIWDINPEVNPDGSFPAMHEDGVVGSIFKGLLGYNGNPNFLEVFIWMFYFVLMYCFFFRK